MRYNNVIKQRFTDIEKVKKTILDKYRPTLSRHQLEIKLFEYYEDLPNSHDRHIRECEALKNRILSNRTHDSDLVMIENQVTLLTYCKELMRKAQQESSKLDNQNNKLDGFSPVIATLKYISTKRILKCKLQREIDDINLEIRRQNLCFQLIIFHQDTAKAETSIQNEDDDLLSSISEQLSQGSKIEEDKLDELFKEIRDLRSKYNLNPLTQQEKASIIRAMGLSKGHWFKCPQGHIYAIGECGGAMQRSVCPECKADIGGNNHKLVDGNELATEMDGARYAAWSEQANMENYVIIDED